MLPGAARRRYRSSASADPAQALLQLAAGVVEAAHYRSLRTIEHAADLLVGEPLHFAEKYYRSMFRGQLGDCFGEAAGDLGVARALVRVAVVPVVGEQRQRILAAVGLARLECGVRELRLAASMIDTEVHGDSVRPGVEAGVTLEPVQALVCLGEGLLRDVECIISVSKHAERERGDLA